MSRDAALSAGGGGGGGASASHFDDFESINSLALPPADAGAADVGAAGAADAGAGAADAGEGARFANSAVAPDLQFLDSMAHTWVGLGSDSLAIRLRDVLKAIGGCDGVPDPAVDGGALTTVPLDLTVDQRGSECWGDTRKKRGRAAVRRACGVISKVALVEARSK